MRRRPAALAPQGQLWQIESASHRNGELLMIQIPQGFRLAAANADFRGKHLDRNDVSLVFSTVPATAAGVFTTNLFRAAPVLVSEEHIAADTEDREDCDEEDDDSHSSQPVRHASPEDYRPVQCFYVTDDCRTGGCES